MTDATDVLKQLADERRQEILCMSAGEDLDARVQEVVFGSTVYHGSNFKRIVVNEPHALEAELIPPYSTEAGAAWLLVEHLACHGFDVSIWRGGARAEVWIRASDGSLDMPAHLAPTFPLALSRAALLVVAEARR